SSGNEVEEALSVLATYRSANARNLTVLYLLGRGREGVSPVSGTPLSIAKTEELPAAAPVVDLPSHVIVGIRKVNSKWGIGEEIVPSLHRHLALYPSLHGELLTWFEYDEFVRSLHESAIAFSDAIDDLVSAVEDEILLTGTHTHWRELCRVRRQFGPAISAHA